MTFSSSQIDQLLIAKDLSVPTAEGIFKNLLTEGSEEAGKLILVLLQKKGEHPDELVGLIRAIRKMEKPLPAPRFRFLVDGCGTGGDGTKTINISSSPTISPTRHSPHRASSLTQTQFYKSKTGTKPTTSSAEF